MASFPWLLGFRAGTLYHPCPSLCVWCRECTPGPACGAHVPPSGCLNALGSEGSSVLCCVAPWALLGFLNAGETKFLLPFQTIPFLQPLLACPMLCINSPRESWAVCIPQLKAATPVGPLPATVLPRFQSLLYPPAQVPDCDLTLQTTFH